jgi:hypothetical protein
MSQAERARGDDLDVFDHLAFTQAHDRALAELFLDLGQGHLQGFGFFGGCGGVRGGRGLDKCVHENLLVNQSVGLLLHLWFKTGWMLEQYFNAAD